MLYYIVTGILFLWNSVQDIKRKSLSDKGLLADAGVILLLFIADGLCSGIVAEVLLSEGKLPWQKLWGVIPGVFVLVLSCVLGGKIGKGDGYLLCISGLALGFAQNLAVLFYGLLFAGAAAAVLLLLRKVKRDTKLPFVPFLTAAYLLTVLMKYV